MNGVCVWWRRCVSLPLLLSLLLRQRLQMMALMVVLLPMWIVPVQMMRLLRLQLQWAMPQVVLLVVLVHLMMMLMRLMGPLPGWLVGRVPVHHVWLTWLC